MSEDELSEADQFIDAVAEGDHQRVSQMLEAGLQVNFSNERGETPFSFACAYDQFEVARLLFAHGAQINTVDKGGGSPLDWALCHGSPQFREWLLGIGATRNDDTYEPWPYPPSSEPCPNS